MKTQDPVFTILETMLHHSPERSYARLNPALRSTLADCISADLPFQPDTFQRIYNELRGSRWFGDGAGSAAGEGYYTVACACNHASACQSFERFAGRPGVLWEETNKQPERLHVGAQFTWHGRYLTVTSMRTDSLVACSYKDTKYRHNGLQVGAEVCYADPHVITHARRDGAALVLRLVKAAKNTGSCTVAARLTITYAEITEVRRTEARRVKAIVDQIAQCHPAKDGKQIQKAVNGQKFRHFQLEIINAAYQKRVKELERSAAKKKQDGENRKRQRKLEELDRTEPDRVEAWRGGANGAWLHCRGTYLRLRCDQVDCSTGNSVSLTAVKRALPVVLARRKDFGKLELPLDSYKVQALNESGVTVGCTDIPWPEVDRLAARLAELAPEPTAS